MNSCASFLFLAFVAGPMGQCPADSINGCFDTLRINLPVVYGIRLVNGLLLEYALPWLMHRPHARDVFGIVTFFRLHHGDSDTTSGAQVDAHLSRSELEFQLFTVSARWCCTLPAASTALHCTVKRIYKQYAQLMAFMVLCLPTYPCCFCCCNCCNCCYCCYPLSALRILLQYDQLESSLKDYSEIVVSFEYTAMFGTALPIAPLFVVLSIILEIKAAHHPPAPLPQGLPRHWRMV